MSINFDDKMARVNAQIDQYQRQPDAQLLTNTSRELSRLFTLAHTPSDMLKLQQAVSRFSEITNSETDAVNELTQKIREACNLQRRENPPS